MKYKSVVILSLCAAFGSGDAFARLWYVEPAVYISFGYDDNPLLGSDSGVTDDSSTVAAITDQSFGVVGADFRLASESPDDLIAVDAALGARRYGEAQLDSELLRGALVYQKRGIRHDYGAETAFTRDSTVETEFLDTGLFEENIDREAISFTPSLTSRYSEKLTGEYSLTYRDVGYDAVDSVFVDYEDYEASGRLTRWVSERLSLWGNAGLLFYRPSQSEAAAATAEAAEEDLYSLTIGFDYLLTSQLELSAGVGRNRVERDFQSVGPDESETSSVESEDTIYTAGLAYRGQTTGSSIEASRSFEPTATGGLSQTDSLNVGISREMTPSTTLTLAATFATREPTPGAPEERKFFSINPGVLYQVNEQFSLQFGVTYRNQTFTNTATGLNRDAESTQYLLTARYNFGRKWIKP